MFGHHRRKREKKVKAEKEAFDAEKAKWAAEEPLRQKEKSDYEKSQVENKLETSKQERSNAREEGKKRANEFFSQDFTGKGLDPKKREAMQYEANKQIKRSSQAANRKLLGEQSMRGIQGRGGVGYAQQQDLQRLAQDAQGGVIRDLTKLDSDLAMKKAAQQFAIEEGEVSQQQLDKQAALDELELAEEKRRARQFEDEVSKLFSRI